MATRGGGEGAHPECLAVRARRDRRSLAPRAWP